MTKIPFHRKSRRLNSIANRKSQIANGMAFTIVELLTVIAIIAVLAALLLPVLAAAKLNAQKKQARLQISDIVQQIQNYDSQYSRMPISPAAQQAAVNGCFTYGGLFNGTMIGTTVPALGGSILTNSEVVAILMDITAYTNGVPTVNANHQKNPQQTAFLNAKMSNWDPSKGGKPLPGVGTDLVYRDPWGNPYIITMDLNDDNLCRDSVYSNSVVSASGLNGLIQQSDGSYVYHGNVMVWSAGPDGKVDPTQLANQGVNSDNIISWQ